MTACLIADKAALEIPEYDSDIETMVEGETSSSVDSSGESDDSFESFYSKIRATEQKMVAF